MSVPNQTPYIIYNANGLTTVFPFEFYVISASDIQVTFNGVEITTGYSVSGVGNTGGGDVTFITPPAAGTVVMIERVVPTFRLTDYQDNGDLLADTVNKDFDRLWMAIQRYGIHLGLALRRPLFGGPFNAEGFRIANGGDPVDKQDFATKNYVDSVSIVRALRVPEAFVPLLPPADYRANKLLAFNAAGSPIVVLPPSGSASDVMIELAKPTGANNIGYGDVTVAERLSYEIYITNADPTGSTSAVAVIQAAIDANRGKKLVLPAGDYLIDDTIFIPRNTQLCGVAPIPTMYHDMVHNNAIVDLMADEGYTKLHLRGEPTKRILTDVVHGADDPARSMGIVFAESGAVLDNIAVIGWRKRTDGTYEPPSLTAPNDAGAVPCFDIPVFNASVMSVRMHDTMIACYIPEGSACYWIDASRGEQRNGNGNDFNVNDRIKSVGPNDSRQIDCCFWWFHPTAPSTSDARNYYGLKVQGHDDDIRNLTRYPSESASATAGAANWIWGGLGTSDHKFRGSVIKGISLDCTIKSYVGDDRLNYTKESVVGGVNGYPGPWQNLTGAGGKFSFADCVIRQGDINLKRVAQVWFSNTYGEAGYFYMTNLTGYVTISDGFIGQGPQEVTINNPNGTTPSAYNRLNSPLYKVVNAGNDDRFGLFHSSGAHNYYRPHIDNAVEFGFDDGSTVKRWRVTHSIETRTNKITSTSAQNYVEVTRAFKFSGYATGSYPSTAAFDTAVIYDTTTKKLKLWNGTTWETIQSS